MRKLFVISTAVLVVFGLAGAAGASPYNWSGTSSLSLGDFPVQQIQGGGVATVNGSGGGSHLDTITLSASRGQVHTSFTQFVTDPDTIGNGITKIQYIGVAGGTGFLDNISGALQNTSQDLSGTIPIVGLVKIGLIGTGFIDIPLQQGNAAVGVGGLLFAGNKAIRISIQANPWSIKTVAIVDEITTTGKANQTLITVTLKGFGHGPASNTTSTAAVSGVVQVVTPTQVTTNLALGSNAQIASGVSFRIHFIPEPGLLLLIGSGVAGLALLGRSRLRRK